MTDNAIYDLLLAVHEKQGKLDSHMCALDQDIGALATSVRKIDIALRGNGSPGALTRISLLEEHFAGLVPAAAVQRLEARLSEHCRGDAAAVERGGHRGRLVAAVVAAVLGSVTALLVACLPYL